MTKDYGLIRDLDGLKKLADKLLADNLPMGFDIETGYHGPPRVSGSLPPHGGAFIVGFSITNDPKWARYVPVRHDFGDNLDDEKAFEIIKPVLEQPLIVAHNMKFEKRHLRKENIEIGVLGDTMLEAYCLSEWKSVGLKALVKDVFDYEQAQITSLFPGLKKKDESVLRFNEVEINPKSVSYACEDAAWCLALHNEMSPRLMKSKQAKVYQIELAILDILCDMEDAGVAVDWEGMSEARARVDPFVEEMEAEIRAEFAALTGKSMAALNLNSSKQLRELLYGEIGMPVTRMTKGSEKSPPQPSTDAIALEALSREYPVVKEMLESREVKNLQKRFDNWLELSTPQGHRPVVIRGREDNRTHASYSQAQVGTGRFAAGDPAIQQCPKDWFWAVGEARETYKRLKQSGEKLKERDIRDAVIDQTGGKGVFAGNFRDFLVAGEGRYLLSFDYSQIELRVMAGLSQEKALLDAFENDEDVHTLTAAMMLGRRAEDVDPDKERPIGKTMNFALLYGMREDSLADRLAISREYARELYQSYFAAFTSITNWMDKMKRDGEARGFTLSWIGRKYKVWEALSENRAIQSKAERVYVNAPVQGGAADFMKLAMIKVKQVLTKKGWWMSKVWLVMNQHDALTFEVDQSIDPLELYSLLRPAVELKVPIFPKIVSDWEFGYQWGSCSKFDPDTAFFKKVHGKWQLLDGTYVPEDEDDMEDAPEEVEVTFTDEARVEETALRSSTPVSHHTLIVTLAEMPDENQVVRFLKLLQQNPGKNNVVLRTPEGDVPFGPSTALDLADQPRVSLALGGASIAYPPEEVDTETLGAGILW
jgi:DNA polymerase-1